MARPKIIIICGGPSEEHGVSVLSGKMVLQHIDREKYQSKLLVLPKEKRKVARILKSGLECDAVFLAMHGAMGEDGEIQGFLESLNIPYTGSGIEASAIALNKFASNTLYQKNGLSVPRFLKVANKKELTLKTPFVIKPIRGGSSFGVYIVDKKSKIQSILKKALKENKEVLVQEYIKGREFTCGVIEIHGHPKALIPTEIISRGEFFDYTSKYTPEGAREITPPNLPKKKIQELQSLALLAHQTLGCEGVSRSDFILKGSDFFILETNTIPGLTTTSLLPQGAKALGISFEELIDLLLVSAFKKAKR